MLGDGPEDFAKQQASKDLASSSEDEPNLLMSDSAEKGFGKLMAGIITDNPLKRMPFLNPYQQQPSEQAGQRPTIPFSAEMDFEDQPKEDTEPTTSASERQSFDTDLENQPLRATTTPPADSGNPYLKMLSAQKETGTKPEKFDVEDPDRGPDDNFGQKTAKVAGGMKDAVIKNQFVQSLSKGVFNLVVSSRQQEQERKGDKALMEDGEHAAAYGRTASGTAAKAEDDQEESPFAFL